MIHLFPAPISAPSKLLSSGPLGSKVTLLWIICLLQQWRMPPDWSPGSPVSCSPETYLILSPTWHPFLDLTLGTGEQQNWPDTVSHTMKMRNLTHHFCKALGRSLHIDDHGFKILVLCRAMVLNVWVSEPLGMSHIRYLAYQTFTLWFITGSSWNSLRFDYLTRPWTTCGS